MTTLCAQQLKQRLHAGDEVITSAVAFPTTVAPIIQNQLVPVFVDAEMGTYNVDVNQLEAALSPKTRIVSHTHTWQPDPDGSRDGVCQVTQFICY